MSYDCVFSELVAFDTEYVDPETLHLDVSPATPDVIRIATKHTSHVHSKRKVTNRPCTEAPNSPSGKLQPECGQDYEEIDLSPVNLFYFWQLRILFDLRVLNALIFEDVDTCTTKFAHFSFDRT